MKRKIVIIVGSQNDLKQCADGLELLREQEANGAVTVRVYVRAMSHFHELLWLLDSFQAEGLETDGVDVIIAGADKAAVLPGVVDSCLRNHYSNTRTWVIGVGFTAKGKKDNQAAELCITQVPDTQVTFAGLGKQGFYKACKLALNGSLPKIKLADIPPDRDLRLELALELAREQ